MGGIGALFVVFLCQAAHGATWYVGDSVSSSGDGRTWATALKKIQEGIDAAYDDDTVIVAEGLYVENILFAGKNIVLQSTDPLDAAVVANTIIDGNESGPVVTFNGTENETCVLSGFTIRNGVAHNGGGICGGTEVAHTRAMIENNTVKINRAEIGGGIASCDGVIENNTISGNSASRDGGAMAFCHGTIQHNTISGNSAATFGGAMALCLGTIQNNTVSGNSAEFGGALWFCNGTMRKNTFSGNSASQFGGGLCFCQGTIQGNTISGNTAEYGGALRDCNGTIRNNAISGNSADYGGGLHDCGGTVQGNTISGNSARFSGGGLRLCNGTIQSNTISGNSAGYGGGLEFCLGTIKNCIIWGNTAVAGAQLHESPVPTYSCIEGWDGGGEGNIATYPKFADLDGLDDNWATWADNDYRLLADSPCIDKGFNEDWMLEATDLDGNPRIANGNVDMGAFEFQGRPWCIITAEGDVATLRWRDFGDGSYTVEWRDDLLQGAWQPASGNWPIGELMWNDVLTREIMRRFYRVESAGVYTDPVGFIRAFAVDPGLTLLSVPLIPADDRLNGEPGCIGDMLKEILTGGASAGDADVVFKWNPKTQTYRTAYMVADVGPGLDGKWWDGETGTLSTMTLGVGECFWVLRRSRQGASP